MFRALVVVATFFTHVYSQTLTQQCLDAWTTFAADPAVSTCMSVQQVLPIATAIQNNASVVSIMDDWLTSLCAQPACNNETMSAVYKILSDKCSDLSGWSSFSPKLYPTWRRAYCLKDANGVLCNTEYLTNVESYSGTVTYAKMENIDSLSLPTSIACTDCNKAQYSTWKDDFPSRYDKQDPAFAALCGAAFVDGQIPPEIVESANPATSTATTTLKC